MSLQPMNPIFDASGPTRHAMNFRIFSIQVEIGVDILRFAWNLDWKELHLGNNNNINHTNDNNKYDSNQSQD